VKKIHTRPVYLYSRPAWARQILLELLVGAVVLQDSYYTVPTFQTCYLFFQLKKWTKIEKIKSEFSDIINIKIYKILESNHSIPVKNGFLERKTSIIVLLFQNVGSTLNIPVIMFYHLKSEIRPIYVIFFTLNFVNI